MNDTDEMQQNMVSNLPLLFAHGYPTSLEKITEEQLENFIPFMVQCSLGYINFQGKVDYSEPEWWPEDVPFTIPINKPKKFEGNWLNKMKEIVIICYQFHKSLFLLRFCNEISAYEPARLRFINNYNSTTSIYDRRTNKLLVTFRNENMSYDQPQRSRKCLLLQKSRSQTMGSSTQQQQMVEPALFDIYLCDNCDAELYSLEAITEHEKSCTSDDDVIICESPIPESTSPLTLDLNENPNNELREAFLLNFNLQSCEVSSRKASSSPVKIKGSFFRNVGLKKEDSGKALTTIETLKRLPRRNRGVYALSRYPTIPLSSPAGQLMIRNTKTLMTEEYLQERLDRVERFCHAPVVCTSGQRPKFLDKRFCYPQVQCTFKKPADYYVHTYIHPRRQFSCKQRKEHFLFLNSLLIKKCRSVSVRLKRITENDIKRLQRPNYNNVKAKRDISQNNFYKAFLHSQNVIDTIDLCSSEEEDENSEKTGKVFIKDQRATPISIDNVYDVEDINKRGKFDGVVNQPKPLQPSVFLFSNYTTENIHLHRFPGSNNNTTSIGDISFQNQENLENSLKKAAEEWSSSPNNRSDRGAKVLQIMSYVDNDVIISKINSSNRTISIDLTS